MSVIVNKRNGKIDGFTMYGDEMCSFLSLVETLWNTSDMTSDNKSHQEGIDAMHVLMKEFV